MAEAAAALSAEDASRGRPYYEKLRSDLRATLEKKRALDRDLQRLEENIANAESAYLDDTAAAGNIIRGFDNYIKASTSTSTTTGGGTSTRRKGGITDQDRIFSRSSVSWVNRDNMNHNLSAPPSESATPAGRETPVATGLKNKKKKVVEKDDGDDSERPAKRNKVSWGRD